MNRTSMLFAAFLAASFVFTSRPPQSPSAEQRNSVPPSHAAASKAGKTQPQVPDLEAEARVFLSAFLNKERAFDTDQKSPEQSPGFRILFATLADPVRTHLAAAFDHDLAALQDGAQDSGYLFDNSWIPWDFGRNYDSLDDQVASKQQLDLRHSYPGILFFRSKWRRNPNGGPYGEGLIVFLLAENPTAGIDISQTERSLELLGWLHAEQLKGTKQQSSPPGKPLASLFAFPDNTALIAGPSYSGSLDSLVDLVYNFRNSPLIAPPARFLVRGGGFTSCPHAGRIANLIQTSLHTQIDLGSAAYRFEPWIRMALDTLGDTGIGANRVAILSEGESLFGESAQESEALPSSHSSESPSLADPSDQGERMATCKAVEIRSGTLNLEFPRDISALRSAYETQGVLDIPASPQLGKRALQIGPDAADTGESIRSYGGVDTVAAQESVLFGISDSLRAHGIRAVLTVATSEQDSYFLTQFIHANNPEVRIVVLGSSRQFMRGSTAQFRGDMIMGSFPFLPRLYDWTAPQLRIGQGEAQPDQESGYLEHDRTEHIFPNDTSQGEYIAVRDLLWNSYHESLPHEYAHPGWQPQANELRPSLYISALGGESAWPVSESEPTPESDKTDGNSHAVSFLSMPFAFAEHFGQSNIGKIDSVIEISSPPIHAGGFWKLLFLLTLVVPLFYCSGVLYANPVDRRAFAYLQPADAWSDWIFLISVPALLSELSFLLTARSISFSSCIRGDHESCWIAAIVTSLVVPLLIVFVNWIRAVQADCFTSGEPAATRVMFAITDAAILVLFVGLIPVVWQPHSMPVAQILSRYREMHWESGLSLLPSEMLAILAVAVWNYGALIGISVLRSRPPLPDFPDDEHISEKAAKSIANAGRPMPHGTETGWYWILVALIVTAAVLLFAFWPGLRPVTSLSSRAETRFVLVLAAAASLLMVLDMVQFAWVWQQLHELLQALDRKTFRRGFVPLRDFNWKSIWSFSNGSLQEMRKVLVAQVDCALQIKTKAWVRFEPQAIEDFLKIREKYSKLHLGNIGVKEYRGDLQCIYQHFASIGSGIAYAYSQMTLPAPVPCFAIGPADNDPFRDEEHELEHLPEWLCLSERFLCLLYVGFLQAIVARLRSLAISIVSIFSLTALAIAIYPFQPIRPLFIVGFAGFIAIGVIMFIAFSQMDKDPVLARILKSDPNKLEWSFYSKYIDVLALPLLTLLSSLLPGGAGRLIDLLRTTFSHTS